MTAHGTQPAIHLHRLAGEQLCGECAVVESGRKVTYDKTRHRALADLAAMYPTDYRRLLLKHRKAAGMRIKREVPVEMTMTQAEKVRVRSAAWYAAAKRLIVNHRAEFDRLYETEKTERGL